MGMYKITCLENIRIKKLIEHKRVIEISTILVEYTKKTSKQKNEQSCEVLETLSSNLT